MSASDIRRERLWAGRTGLRWLLLALATAVFGAVYECFGHGVFSFAMIYAFAYPLLLCALPLLGWCLWGGRGRLPGRRARALWGCGAATLTVGSLVRGTLVIFGTANRLTAAYPVAGALLLAAGACLTCIDRRSAPVL